MAENTSAAQAFRVNKMFAADRQLALAIRLYFEGGDPTGMITLGIAALHAYSERIAHQWPGKSFETWIQAMPLPAEHPAKILSSAHRFLKRANEEPGELLEWPIQRIEALLMAAVQMGEELDQLSLSGCVFRLWYLAKYGGARDASAIGAQELFAEITELTDAEQRALGAHRLKLELARLEVGAGRQDTGGSAKADAAASA